VPVIERLVVAALPALVLVGVAWSDGGFFPRTWGALLLLEAIALAAVGILASRVPREPRAVALVGLLLALTAWQLVSRVWAVAPDAVVLEAQRTLVYAGATAVAFVAVPRRLGPWLVGGVFAGATGLVLSGLVDHLVGPGTRPDRLESPVGYPNAVGILAAVALTLGIGLVLERLGRVSAVAAILCVPVALALYLTLSRGSLLAAAGAVVLLVAIGRWAAASRAHSRVRRRAVVVSAASAGVLLLVSLAAIGVRQARDEQQAPTAQPRSSGRLLTTTTNSRSDYWDVAASMVREEPLHGAGAGGFERTWLRERPALLHVKDAHNLYLETLAELGPLGLAFLLAALLVPLRGARRAARDPLGRAALAAYAALLGHAALDWDWELPVVWLCVVVLGVALAGWGRESTVAITTATRSVVLASAATLCVFAIVVHTGNSATAEAHEALDRGDAGAALAEADRARRFRPSAAEPWQLLGEAELAAGRLERAREHLRRATREDPGSWSAWLALAGASDGRERRLALQRARALNPLAEEIDAIAATDP
jgi:O-antigen ligase